MGGLVLCRWFEVQSGEPGPREQQRGEEQQEPDGEERHQNKKVNDIELGWMALQELRWKLRGGP